MVAGASGDSNKAEGLEDGVLGAKVVIELVVLLLRCWHRLQQPRLEWHRVEFGEEGRAEQEGRSPHGDQVPEPHSAIAHHGSGLLLRVLQPHAKRGHEPQHHEPQPDHAFVAEDLRPDAERGGPVHCLLHLGLQQTEAFDEGDEDADHHADHHRAQDRRVDSDAVRGTGSGEQDVAVLAAVQLRVEGGDGVELVALEPGDDLGDPATRRPRRAALGGQDGAELLPHGRRHIRQVRKLAHVGAVQDIHRGHVWEGDVLHAGPAGDEDSPLLVDKENVGTLLRVPVREVGAQCPVDDAKVEIHATHHAQVPRSLVVEHRCHDRHDVLEGGGDVGSAPGIMAPPLVAHRGRIRCGCLREGRVRGYKPGAPGRVVVAQALGHWHILRNAAVADLAPPATRLGAAAGALAVVGTEILDLLGPWLVELGGNGHMAAPRVASALVHRCVERRCENIVSAKGLNRDEVVVHPAKPSPELVALRSADGNPSSEECVSRSIEDAVSGLASGVVPRDEASRDCV